MSAAKTNATVEKNKTKKPVDDVALPADDVIEDEKDESLEDEDLLEGIPEEELKAVESSAVAALPKVNSTRARARARGVLVRQGRNNGPCPRPYDAQTQP